MNNEKIIKIGKRKIMLITSIIIMLGIIGFSSSALDEASLLEQEVIK